MTVIVDSYPAGSPESAEWRAIRQRNVRDFRRREAVDRFGRPRAAAGVDLRAEAERLVAEVEEHLDRIATLTTSGWLLFPDVSEHQGSFNWQWCVDAGFKVGCYKATEGRTYLDGQATRNAAEIRRLGLLGMCYGFVYWSTEYDTNPALWNEQGRWFAQHAPADFAHAIDVEMLCSGKSTDVARVVAGYRSVYPNHPLMIYTNRALYASRSKGSPADPSTLGLLEWHAGVGNGFYTSATGTLPAEWSSTGSLANSLTGFPPRMVWQFTDHGAVAGQLVDGNGFQGSTDDFRSIFITGGVSDDMSQDDVKAINAHTDAQIAALLAALTDTSPGHLPRITAQAVHTQQLYADTWPRGDGTSEPLTFARAARESLRGVQTAVGQTDTVKAALSALGGRDALAATIVDGVRSELGGGVDYDRLGQIVAGKLDEHVRSFTISTDAPA